MNVLTADGRESTLNGFGTVLQRILSLPIQPGDLLAIRYLGKTAPRSGQQAYRDFRHVLRNPDGTPKGRRRRRARRHRRYALDEPPVEDVS